MGVIKTPLSDFVNDELFFGGISEFDSTTSASNEVKIKPSDGAADDSFGISVAIGCNRIVVGADSDADNGSFSGSAYIFNLNGTQLAKIKPSDGASSDRFGECVSIGSSRIVVGSYGDDDNGSDSGSAYIFDLSGNQIAKIKPNDGAASDYFGDFVAVGSGRIVVGSPFDDDNGSSSGSAYIFDLNGNQIAKIKPSDGADSDFFGSSLAVGSGRIVIGAYGDDDNGSASGSAYIFDLNGNQLAKIKASDGASGDNFGRAVSIGSGRIVIGAQSDTHVTTGAGSAYIFDMNGTQLSKIIASDPGLGDGFGNSVSASSGRVIIGSRLDDPLGLNSGSVYLNDLFGNQITKIVPSDGAGSDYYGGSVAIGCGRIAVGAYGDDDNGSGSGSVYVYTVPNQRHFLDILDET